LNDNYRSVLFACFTTMLRGRDGSAIALHYIAAAQSEALSKELIRELVIFARGDIGQSQMDAIKAIALIKEEPEAKKALLALLSHWDADARLAAMKVLETMKEDKDVVAAISRRRASETDDRIKKLIERVSP
jgi:hypothetical protein